MTLLEYKIACAIGGTAGDYCNPCTDKKIAKCEECLRTAQAVIACLTIEDLELMITQKRLSNSI